jgi:hypothetical protein
LNGLPFSVFDINLKTNIMQRKKRPLSIPGILIGPIIGIILIILKYLLIIAHFIAIFVFLFIIGKWIHRAYNERF